mgnify:CR=1 FL=1
MTEEVPKVAVPLSKERLRQIVNALRNECDSLELTLDYAAVLHGLELVNEKTANYRLLLAWSNATIAFLLCAEATL